MSLRLWMVFEAVAPQKDAVEDSLEDHIESLKTEKGVEVIEVETDEAQEMEDPHEGLEKGFSQVMEMRVEFDSFYKAIESVINYGPTYVNIEAPDNYDLGLKEAQDTMQQVTNTMHKYAQMGVGGVIISRNSDES